MHPPFSTPEISFIVFEAMLVPVVFDIDSFLACKFSNIPMLNPVLGAHSLCDFLQVQIGNIRT